MSRLRPFRTLGFALLGLVALSIGSRPALRAQQPTATIAPAFVGGAFGGANQEAEPPTSSPATTPRMTLPEAKTRMKLYEKIPVNFPNDTPLEDLINHVRQTTVDKVDFPDGLPIYVDPVGLQDADKTLADTIRIDLKGIPLATSLKLALAQLNLAYWVNPDGLLIITASIAEDMPADVDTKILSTLSALRREVSMLRAEVGLLRGVPRVPMMGSVGGSMGGSVGGKMEPSGGSK